MSLGLLTWTGAASAQCSLTGTGTSADPYQVGKFTDLVQVGLTCGMSATYKMTADIDTVGQAGQAFLPIGTNADTSAVFTGTFHGMGYSIKNLAINSLYELNVGLFGEVGNGTIDSLTVANANIVGKSNNVGGLAGLSQGSIVACYVSGVVNGGRNGVVGGLVGENNGTILRSRSLVLTNGDTGSYLGGLVGMNDTDGVIRNSYTSGSILSKVYNNVMGGVVGYNSGTVTGSYSTGRVNGGYISVVGGVVGVNNGFVDSCWATGASVNSTLESQVGGVVGINDSGSILSASYSSVPVACGSGCQVGGVVGVNNGAIHTSYSTDSVTGGTYSMVGGVTGQNGTGCTIRFSYASGRLSGSDSTSVGGVAGENSGIIRTSYGSGIASANVYSRLGGVVGSNENHGSIADVYAIGRIMSGNECSMGGIVGENRGEVLRSYAVTTSVRSTTGTVGGAVGMNGPSGKMTSLYWNSAVSQIEMGVGYDVEGGANGVPGNLNTVLMHDSTNFRGFDFLTTWKIDQGLAYPNLRNIVNSPAVFVGPSKSHARSFASLRRVGSDLILQLPVAAEVRVLNLQGRQILPSQRYDAGRQMLNLPNGSSAAVVQVRSQGKIANLIAEPVR
jgi:hypothetical protein